MARRSTLKGELIEAGLQFLETHSPDELTMRKIAAACHVTPHAIYNHFKNKSALLQAIYDEVQKQAAEYSMATMRDPALSLSEKLFRLCVSYLKLQRNYPNYKELIDLSQPRPYYMVDFSGETDVCKCAFPGWPKMVPPEEGDDENSAPFEHLAFFSFVTGLPRILHEGMNTRVLGDEERLRILIGLYLKRVWPDPTDGR